MQALKACFLYRVRSWFDITSDDDPLTETKGFRCRWYLDDLVVSHERLVANSLTIYESVQVDLVQAFLLNVINGLAFAEPRSEII